MKKYLIYSIVVLFTTLLYSCKKEEVNYEHINNAEVTFTASALKVPALTDAMNGKVAIPLFRGNSNQAVSVPVTITGGEGIYTPDKTAFEFAAGENVAYINFQFNMSALGGKPEAIAVEVTNPDMVAPNGITKTSFTLVRQLTYEKIGTGTYYSDWYEQSWPQDIYKAKEGNFYMLESCWVKGTNFTFFFDGSTVDWYTVKTGYNYGSYGPLALRVNDKHVGTTPDGNIKISLFVNYYLPEFNNYDFGAGQEYIIFP